QTGGSAFTVIDEGVGNDSKLSMMVSLMDSFRAVIRHITSSETSTLVHSQEYHGGIASTAEGSFMLDHSLGLDMYFFIYYYDLNHVGNKIELTMPSGKTITSAYMQEDGDANVVFINIPSAERGKWTYQVENRADSHQGLIMQVTASKSTNMKINMRVWTSLDTNKIIGQNQTTPIIVYTELKDGDVPMLKVKVTARLRRLGTNASGNPYSSINFDLYDNGLGDPDITGDDGVYSRYLPLIPHLQIISGRYELSITADSNNGQAVKPVSTLISNEFKSYLGDNGSKDCCGSSITYDHLVELPSFQRSKIYGMLTLESQSEKDTVGPNRILDLLAKVNTTSQEIILQWTAPGDDFDFGLTHHYEAILAETWEEANLFSGDMLNGLPLPLSAGVRQSVDIHIEKYDTILYVAIRAVDESGNHGSVSNIVSGWVPHPPTTTTQPTIFEMHDSIDLANKALESTDLKQLNVGGFKSEELTIIIGSVCGFFLIIVILAIFCFVTATRRKINNGK
ncbi:unnamed protein product, partial [Meganyctiphanes norvegica]